MEKKVIKTKHAKCPNSPDAIATLVMLDGDTAWRRVYNRCPRGAFSQAGDYVRIYGEWVSISLVGFSRWNY